MPQQDHFNAIKAGSIVRTRCGGMLTVKERTPGYYKFLFEAIGGGNPSYWWNFSWNILDNDGLLQFQGSGSGKTPWDIVEVLVV